MPQSAEQRVDLWVKRLTSANKAYDKWSERYDTKRLEEYYLGRQWKGMPEEEARKRYVINLIYSSIEVNKPSLIFSYPKARVQARPQRAEDLGSGAAERARLSEDIIQTFIEDPDFDFEGETALALHEAHFRFGVIEVGYTADYMDNPDAGKPVLKEDDKTEVKDSDGNTVMQGSVITTSEQLFIKRIPASQFRVSISSKNKISRNDFIAYYEWHYVEDVKRNKVYKNTSGLKSTGMVSKDIRDESVGDELEHHHGMVKIWKIWDLRAKKRHVIADGHKKFLQEGIDFKYHPFAIIKFHEILDSFYPLPPVYQWLDPQDEVNETRDAQRAHRRRFYRRYQMIDGTFPSADEQEKMETGGDGVIVTVTRMDGIKPIEDAPLAADNWRHLDESKNDFIAVSAVGGEQRGVADAETATQASIIDVRSRLRESAARVKVQKWLAEISRLILLTVRDNMALPFWVKRTVDPYADPAEAEKVGALYAQITSDEIGDTDQDVFVDLASMSPVTEDAQRQSWAAVLGLMTNPTLLMLLSGSEVLMRKTLAMYGIKAENEIKEIQRIAMEVATQMQLAAMAGGKPAGGSASPPSSAKTGPNGNGGGKTVTGDDLASVIGAATQGGSGSGVVF